MKTYAGHGTVKPSFGGKNNPLLFCRWSYCVFESCKDFVRAIWQLGKLEQVYKTEDTHTRPGLPDFHLFSSLDF